MRAAGPPVDVPIPTIRELKLLRSKVFASFSPDFRPAAAATPDACSRTDD